MSEFIIWESDKTETTDNLGVKHSVSHFEKREEIVRCRDCAYICNREYTNGLEWHTCGYFDSAYAEVDPNGFCAWGERRQA